ncbi:hypothetical protein CUMW_169550 [Citrus unshiu]|uniref:Uncharacterized protein n=2 Tax=Citrus TaxID=2706 RepID=A0A067F2T5_CITSI|nr:hypothetical protein CISIN_1g036420mg [Citrus sinensis]GAY56137.1 hypothetical protein CUMW_169550 [Citrus unshiu]
MHCPLFLRVLARVYVPIIYKDWRLVLDKYKEALWPFQVLQSIRKSFRNLKYTWTNGYILPNKSDCKKLREPPLRYIRQNYWDLFVKDYINDKFAVHKLDLIQYSHRKFSLNVI